MARIDKRIHYELTDISPSWESWKWILPAMGLIGRIVLVALAYAAILSVVNLFIEGY